MKRLLLGVFLLTFLAVSATEASEGRDPVVLQLKWFHQFQFAGYYAAQAKGFYRDAGLEVDIREGNPRTDAVKEVVEGRAHYGISNSDVLLRRLRGDPVVVLAAIFQHSPLVIIATEESGIRHPQHMKGLRVGISRSTRDAELLAMLRNEGVSLDDIQPPKGGSFSFSMYYDGSADAGSAYITNEPYHLEQKNIPYQIIRPLTYGIDFYGDCLLTSETEAARHPDRARRFREASLRGWEYAMAHPEEMADLIIDRYGSKKPRDHLLYEADKMRDLILPRLVEMGHMNPGRWRHIADTFVDLGMIGEDYDLEGFLYDPDPRPDIADIRRFLLLLSLVGAAVGVGVACLLAFNRRLRKEVREREEAEKTLRFQAELMDQIQDIILATDAEGRIQYANEAMSQALQKPRETLIGRRIHGLDGDETGEKQQRIIDETLARGQWRGRLSSTRGDGTTRLLEARTWLVRDVAGEPTGMVGVSTDVTDRVRMEDDLRLARNEAVAANRAKSVFLANMSHELRTPLNAILGFARILQKDVGPEQRDGLQVIQKSGEHLLSLINDMLDLAKVESGRIQLEPATFHFPAFLGAIAEMFRPRFQEKGLFFQLETEAEHLAEWVCGDERRIRQVLLNLLGNALKFTETGGVTVQVARRDEKVRFTVQDTGVGIATEAMDRVFDPFFQVDCRSFHAEGTGLGLSISRMLVEVMGGELRVESEPGQGSVFWFSVTLPPVDGGENPSPFNHAIVGIHGPPPAVLVVDDDARNRILFQQMLASVGMAVRTAEDGEAALAEARKKRPDAVVTDLRMPGMDGMELIRKLRADPVFAGMPIIATSANVFGADRRLSLEIGADRFLPKPVDPDRLLIELGRLLSLEWRYEAEGVPMDVGPKDMEIPPAAALADLLDLVETGDLSALEETLAEIAAGTPRFAPFVDRLGGMVRRFEMKQIRTFLRECME